MKGTLGMSQEEVNRVSKLSATELEQLYEMEQELESELQRQLEELVPVQLVGSLNLKPASDSESSVIENLNRQLVTSTAQKSK